MIIIIDLGSQFTYLISKRLNELNVINTVLPNTTEIDKLKGANGIILSGGPASIYDRGSPNVDTRLFGLGIPILGICYGMQLIVWNFGGEVAGSKTREYGRSRIELVEKTPLWNGLTDEFDVWMSHSDHAANPGDSLAIIAYSKYNASTAAIVHVDAPIYGIQFHPEVVHTQHGNQILSNFADICGCARKEFTGTFVDHEIVRIKRQIGDDKVVCGLSGGVDSAVTALLVNKAVGDNLTCIFVDTGLLREGEVEEVESAFRPIFGDRLKVVDASQRFLSQLVGVDDPETKRKIIGHVFIDVFKEEADKIDGAKFLAQGTLYPDVIESSSHSGNSVTIKSHHNVGGLPEELGFELVEPLRSLFKDEARSLGRQLGLCDALVNRQPFPGPGLAIRIVGRIDEEKLRILRSADKIVRDEIGQLSLSKRPWQYFCVLLPTKSVGVMGDGRTYEYTCVVRAVDASDGMTADWSKLDHGLLEKISSRISNEVRGINRVCYDISSKPPATIEWE